MFEPDAELHNWRLDDAYTPGKFVVRGEIRGDKKGRFADGVRVCTSILQSLENGRLTTRNSKYLLVNT